MPDDDSTDYRYYDGNLIWAIVGPLALSFLLRANLESLHTIGIGETVKVEWPEAQIINDSDKGEKTICQESEFTWGMKMMTESLLAHRLKS